jgi:hypothetical protein
MSLHSLQKSTIGHEEILLRQSANGVGVSYAGLEGTLGGDAHRILVRVVIPKTVNIDVRFSAQPLGESL